MAKHYSLLQKLQQVRPKTSRKNIAIGSVVATALLIAAIAYGQTITPKTLTSPNKQIALEHIRPDMKIKNGDTISGEHALQRATTLYYIVTAKDGQRVLGAGNVKVNEQHQFSTKLAFDDAEYKNQKGQVLIYLQDEQGKRLDSVETTVIFK